jgi:ribosomal protein S6--L-glutamate ligase
MLAQRFVTSPGRDIGACVLGGRFAGAFYRVAAEGQWLTTTAAGGTYAPCKLPPKGVALAEDAACAFDLDYTVVDLVETDAGYLTYEVSAFGGFRGLWEAYRVDVAQHYAEYIKHDLLA